MKNKRMLLAQSLTNISQLNSGDIYNYICPSCKKSVQITHGSSMYCPTCHARLEKSSKAAGEILGPGIPDGTGPGCSRIKPDQELKNHLNEKIKELEEKGEDIGHGSKIDLTGTIYALNDHGNWEFYTRMYNKRSGLKKNAAESLQNLLSNMITWVRDANHNRETLVDVIPESAGEEVIELLMNDARKEFDNLLDTLRKIESKFYWGKEIGGDWDKGSKKAGRSGVDIYREIMGRMADMSLEDDEDWKEQEEIVLGDCTEEETIAYNTYMAKTRGLISKKVVKIEKKSDEERKYDDAVNQLITMFKEQGANSLDDLQDGGETRAADVAEALGLNADELYTRLNKKFASSKKVIKIEKKAQALSQEELNELNNQIQEDIRIAVEGGEREGQAKQDAFNQYTEIGDLVDFEAYGLLYLVSGARGDKWWVTDLEKERFNTNARGWYIRPSYAVRILERVEEGEVESEEDEIESGWYILERADNSQVSGPWKTEEEARNSIADWSGEDEVDIYVKRFAKKN